MVRSSRWWSPRKAARRPGRSRPPSFEWLEDRTLPAGHTLAAATQVTLDSGSAWGEDVLASFDQVDVYRVPLAAGDRVRVSVSADSSDPSLDAVLRVFDASGRAIAFNDNFRGRDP